MNGQTLSSKPTTNLCSAGTPTTVTVDGNAWIWQCQGTNGGNTDGCVAYKGNGSGGSSSSGGTNGGVSNNIVCAGAVDGVPTVNCFLDSLGVNQHLGWGDPSTGVYFNAGMEELELAYLGIHQVRDNPPNDDVLSDFETMATSGIKFDFSTGAQGDYPTVLSQQLHNIDALNQAVPGSVVSIEGPNELNCQLVSINGVDTSNASAGVAIQQYLYSTIKGDPNLSDVLVANNSTHTSCPAMGGYPQYTAAEGNMDAWMDLGNWHVYTGGVPAAAILQGISDDSATDPTKPMIITEFGYGYTQAQTGLSDADAGRFILFGYADAFKDGVVALYVYELMDNHTGDGNAENNFGLFHTDGSSKAAGDDIHNMTSVLGDTAITTGTPTAPGTAPSVSGTGSSLVLVNGVNGYDVLVWDEGGSSSATVNLGATYAVVNVYDPVQDDAPIQTLSNVSQVNVATGGDLIIVTATSSSSGKTAGSSSSGSTTSSSGTVSSSSGSATSTSSSGTITGSSSGSTTTSSSGNTSSSGTTASSSSGGSSGSGSSSGTTTAGSSSSSGAGSSSGSSSGASSSGSSSGSTTTVNGLCGSVSGQTLSSAPTTNLCSAGTPSTLTTDGSSWIWTCEGSGAAGANTAGCYAYSSGTNGGISNNIVCAGAVNGVDTVNCFLDSLGVNQHLGWGDPSTGVYFNGDLEQLELAYLGIHQVRDAPPNGDVLSQFQAMATSGIKFDLITAPASQDVVSSLSGDLARIDALVQSNPGSVLYVEGANELNCQIVYFNGSPSSDPSTAAQIQQNLYNAVKADSTLTGILVANSTISIGGCDDWQAYIATEGAMATDVGNWHPYAGAAAPGTAIMQGIQLAAQNAPGKPSIMTEWGYYNPGWASEQQAAPWIVMGYADAFKGGATQSYIYELFDVNTGDGNDQDNFGLFHNDGSPKPAADAISNMTTILATTASTGATPRTPAGGAPGVSGASNSLVLVNGQSGYDILVWDEGGGGVSASVNLGATYGTVNVYDPVQSAVPIQALGSTSQVNVSAGSGMAIITATIP